MKNERPGGSVDQDGKMGDNINSKGAGDRMIGDGYFWSRVSAVGSLVRVFRFGCGFGIILHLYLCPITRT